MVTVSFYDITVEHNLFEVIGLAHTSSSYDIPYLKLVFTIVT